MAISTFCYAMSAMCFSSLWDTLASKSLYWLRYALLNLLSYFHRCIRRFFALIKTQIRAVGAQSECLVHQIRDRVQVEVRRQMPEEC